MTSPVPIHIERLGPADSPTVLLLNGSGSPTAHLRPFAQELAKEHHVLLPSFAGYDGVPRAAAYSLEAERETLETAIAAVGAGPLHLIGFSFGAYRALSLIASGKLEIRSVHCLAGLATIPNEDRPLFAQFATMARARAVPGALLAARYLSPAFAAAHPSVADEVSHWLDPIDGDALGDELDEIAGSADLRPGLSARRVLAYARVGSADLAAPLARTREIAEATGGSIDVVEGAGHLLLLEDFPGTLDWALRSLPPRRP